MGIADEEKVKGKKIEYLLYISTEPYQPEPIEIAEDYTVPYSFETQSLLNFKVPLLPKYEALFFEVQAQVFTHFVDYYIWRLTVGFRLNIISDVIHENICVFMDCSIADLYRTNNCLDQIYRKRSRRNLRMIMRKNNLDWWQVLYKDTGEAVPEYLAKDILNKLIDNGFDVEFKLVGTVRGIKNPLWLYPVIIEVTGLSKEDYD